MMNVLEEVKTALFSTTDVGVQSTQYTELILNETPKEVDWREEIQTSQELEKEEKVKQLESLEKGYWYRRLINDWYFKQLKQLMLSGKFA
jgi:hypothetical protein